ncbi:alpha/beta hydrolase family protein [Desertivirga arenae]|uniref:alpha/beta hydrolase family protein n=1 Tax=Desertivirga arenae TaxID=2810309 RepID=UPI001A9732B9|nr:hypothetical protein [Pedobacter sp. SYSU D00823]
MLKWFSIVLLLVAFYGNCFSAAGKWASKTTGTEISFRATDAKAPVKDFNGKYATIVYLENLNVKKLGKNSNKKDVKWLLSQGYRVIELDYKKHAGSVSPQINNDIIAINDSIASGSFCGFKDCSTSKTYVLFEGYRILRNVSYFKDNPSVYNTPTGYLEGDSLHLDIIYPANSRKKVPLVLSFSYSNSYATFDPVKKVTTDAGRDQRVFLSYSFAGFNDSFLEGAPANGIAWAIADHPKYCEWGKGKPLNGPNDAYKSFQTNPDAAQKVKSAIRTVRAMGGKLNLSGKIGIYGFSRGSTAGSLAIGDKHVPEFENAGPNQDVSDEVQAAALGPGVFDYTQIYNVKGDGDGNLESRCPLVWGPMEKNYDLWQSMGAAGLVESQATAPVLFFYNTDDEAYYQDQISHFQTKLKSLGVPVSTLMNYGKGHAVPQTAGPLNQLYDFFKQYLHPPKVHKNGR